MFFALGFLVASLCALVLVPILDKRAMRLARRRIDGLFPMSVREIAAERDALRAGFAVAQRRMERKVETAEGRRHADMAALGTRELEVAALKRDVESRDASLSQRKAEIEAALARIAGLDADLTRLRGEHGAGLAALTALEDAHRDILVDLKAARRERDGTRHDLQEVMATEAGAEALARGKALEAKQVEAVRAASALQVLRAEHDAVLADRDGLRTAEQALAEALTSKPAEQRDEDKTAAGEADPRSRIADVAEQLGRRERLPAVEVFPAPAAARS